MMILKKIFILFDTSNYDGTRNPPIVQHTILGQEISHHTQFYETIVAVVGAAVNSKFNFILQGVT
jgi:hypothetical protein